MVGSFTKEKEQMLGGLGNPTWQVEMREYHWQAGSDPRPFEAVPRTLVKAGITWPDTGCQHHLDSRPNLPHLPSTCCLLSHHLRTLSRGHGRTHEIHVVTPQDLENTALVTFKAYPPFLIYFILRDSLPLLKTHYRPFSPVRLLPSTSFSAAPGPLPHIPTQRGEFSLAGNLDTRV